MTINNNVLYNLKIKFVELLMPKNPHFVKDFLDRSKQREDLSDDDYEKLLEKYGVKNDENS